MTHNTPEQIKLRQSIKDAERRIYLVDNYTEIIAELLEALEEQIIDRLKFFPNGYEKGMCPKIDRANAAIQKARGEA